MRILVFNCGSSSLKFELMESRYPPAQQPEEWRRVTRGTFEEIEPRAHFSLSDVRGHKRRRSEPISDHKTAALRSIEWLGRIGCRTKHHCSPDRAWQRTVDTTCYR